MAGVIATIPKFQFSANGVPMVGGTLDTYIAGSTTPATTWQDSALTIANTNPISLDARGECVLWLDPAVVYKFVLKNAQGVIQWTQDNISNPAALANSLRADLAASSGASLVGFLQAGAGAVATTVQSKLRECVSVRDFGAVGDGITDDRPALERAINSVSGGGDIYFPPGNYLCNSYSSNAVLAAGQYQVLPIYSNQNFRFSAGAQVTVGAFFNDKRFRLFNGYNAIATGSLTKVSNVSFFGGVIDFAGATNRMISGYLAPRDGIDFAYCSVARVYGTVFQNGAITNAITAGTYTLGDDFIARDCSFIDLVQEDAAQTDHTSIYASATNSHIIDCNFTLTSVQGARTAAAVELHRSYSSWVGGVVRGYCRGSFSTAITAESPNVTNHLYANIDYSGRNALVFTFLDDAANTLKNLTIQGCRVKCTQATGDSALFNLQQGLLADGLGLGLTSGVLVQGNVVDYGNTVLVGSDTLVQCASSWSNVVIQDNVVNQSTKGITVTGAGVNSSNWKILNNSFLTAFGAVASKFFNIAGANVSQFAVKGNIFDFSGVAFDTPIFFGNTGTFLYSHIAGNLFPTATPTTKDFAAPAAFYSSVTNNAQYAVYTASMVYPTMGAGTTSQSYVSGVDAVDARLGSTFLFKGSSPSGLGVSPAGAGNTSATIHFVITNTSGGTFSAVTVPGVLRVDL